MAKRRVSKKARVQAVAITLALFVVVAIGIVWRKSAGYTKSLELRQLDAKRAALESDRARLVNEIRSGMSLGRLGPVVSARLGLRVPSDSQVVSLPKPAPRGGS